MKYTVLMGSPRKHGNTAALLDYFLDESRKLGVEQEVIYLYDRNINPCLGCKACQDAPDYPGCVQQDDFQAVFDAVRASDLLVLATPIYAWFCTAPMKAALDRFIYAGCRYYGREKLAPSCAGKKVATLTTCGYPAQKGADLWDAGLGRICKHSGMEYLGMLCRRDVGKPQDFTTTEAEQAVREFARTLYMKAGETR